MATRATLQGGGRTDGKPSEVNEGDGKIPKQSWSDKIHYGKSERQRKFRLLHTNGFHAQTASGRELVGISVTLFCK